MMQKSYSLKLPILRSSLKYSKGKITLAQGQYRNKKVQMLNSYPTLEKGKALGKTRVAGNFEEPDERYFDSEQIGHGRSGFNYPCFI